MAASVRTSVLVIIVGGVVAGCPVERLFAKDVGAGVARLSVRNAAVLAKAVDDDVRCGFDSDAVKGVFVVDGDIGELGTVTWTVSDCTVDFGELHVVTTDCNGDERSVGGSATVSATRTVRGVITGDATTPVIPMDNSAANLRYEASVNGWQVRLSNNDSALTMREGTIAFAADVHLARSLSMSVCSIDTAELTLHSLTITDADLSLDNAGHVFDVPMPALTVNAQLGQWEAKENFIAGSVTVWDEVVSLADAEGGTVLDPDYDRETFQASYACKEDLLVPQDYACPDITDTVGDGAARLLLSDIGNAVQLAVADDRCGFASAGVVQRAQVTGEVGRDGGEVAFTITEPCAIELPASSLVSTSCTGTETRASGRALVRGTMRQRGRVTGDPTQPIVPTSRDAVEITFDVTLDGFSVTTDGTKHLTVTSGGATGRMRPRLGKDTVTGACSIPTPVVTFDGVTVKPGTEGLLKSGPLAVKVSFVGGQFDAQLNRKDGPDGLAENRLDGDVTIAILGNDARAVDVSGDLDPAYDPAQAAALTACIPNLVVPTSDDECSFEDVLAQNAARLIVQSAGTLASMINSDDGCGFEDTLGVLMWPSDVQGEPGDPGSLTWDVAGCELERPADTVHGEDCVGGQTFVEGNANFVDVSRTVRGERETKFFVIDSIVPRAAQSVDLELREVALTEFATWSITAGRDEPDGVLVIHDGVLSALVQPATGARADDPATFDVATPVARLSRVTLSGNVTLTAQGKTFHFRVDNAELTATNGRFLGRENTLDGTISVDGGLHGLAGLALNPAYSATAFEQSYTCNEALLGPVR